MDGTWTGPHELAPRPMITIIVIGAGIAGLWQALTLARAGHASRWWSSPLPMRRLRLRRAGAPVACWRPTARRRRRRPWCGSWGWTASRTGANSGHSGPGHRRWQSGGGRRPRPGGLAPLCPHDRGPPVLDAAALAALEPALDGRFASALHYAGEAHVDSRAALAALLQRAASAGVTLQFGRAWTPAAAATPGTHWTIDCRGIAARDDLPTCAACAGKWRSSARRMWRCAGRSGCCIRACRSTRCRGEGRIMLGARWSSAASRP